MKNKMLSNLATLDRPVRSGGLKYRADIEGLRAVAVLFVVGFHFGVGGLDGGFVGVDIFYVISGYLITTLLVREITASGTIGILRFYGRRARRLLPAALTVSLATLLLAYFLISPVEQATIAASALSASLYISNFWFLFNAADYFAADSAANPFLHTWSLSVEEQFYLVWPLCILFAPRFFGARWGSRGLIIALTLLSFALFVGLSLYREKYAFFASPARAWEFGLGALASSSLFGSLPRSRTVRIAAGWVGFCLILASLVLLSLIADASLIFVVVPTLGTALICLSGEHASTRSIGRLLSIQPLPYIGKISYSLYLWHWPILVFAKALVPVDTPAVQVACLALTFACAVGSYILIEHPIRENRMLRERPWASVGLGLCLTLCGAVAAVSAHRVATQAMASGTQKLINDMAGASAIGAQRGCLVGFSDGVPVRCDFGAANPSKSIVLFGDSHADQWSSALADLADSKGWRLVTFLKSSCAVADIPVYNNRQRRMATDCDEWRAASVAAITGLRPDLVIVADFTNNYVAGPLSLLDGHGVTPERWVQGLATVASAFAAASIPTLVIQDNPDPNQDMRVCLSRAAWRRAPLAQCSADRALSQNEAARRALRALPEDFPTVHVVDVTDQVCQGPICPAMLDDVVVYRDGHHITTAMAQRLLPFVEPAIIDAMR